MSIKIKTKAVKTGNMIYYHKGMSGNLRRIKKRENEQFFLMWQFLFDKYMTMPLTKLTQGKKFFFLTFQNLGGWMLQIKVLEIERKYFVTRSRV